MSDICLVGRHAFGFSVKENNDIHPAYTDNFSKLHQIGQIQKSSHFEVIIGINGFRCFRFITGLFIQSFLFAMNKLLKDPLFTLLNCLITHFFMISFTSISNNFDVLVLLPIGKEYLIEKFSFERVLHNHLLNPRYHNPF